MRLAFIKKRFSFHGGGERYLQTLITDLVKKGHEIHVFANSWPEGGQGNVLFHKVDMASGSFLSTVTFNRNVKKTIDMAGARPDCVISLERTTCQDIYRAGEGCHAEWLEIRSKIEPFYKNLSFKVNPLHISLLGIEKRLFAGTPAIVANSKMVKDHIIKHYAVPSDRITIIYNGVDLARFSSASREVLRKDARTELGLPEDTKALLFVGSGFHRKGLRTLVNAVSYLKRENIKAIVLGKGNTGQYKILAEKLGVIDKFVFPGTQEQIEKFYAASDIFVLPTLYDPFSNATLEAMASGLPVITTKNNGVAELIENGQEGFVTETLTDPEELAVRINLSLEQTAVMGPKARKKAEGFPIGNAATDFVKLIERTRGK